MENDFVRAFVPSLSLQYSRWNDAASLAHMTHKHMDPIEMEKLTKYCYDDAMVCGTDYRFPFRKQNEQNKIDKFIFIGIMAVATESKQL